MKRKHRRPSPPPAGRPAASGSPAPLPATKPPRWFQSSWPGSILIFVAVLLVYWPALRGGFIWDDDAHIAKNDTLHSLAGLGAIWTTPGATMQYYPLSFTVWWVDYHLWQLHTLGYHLQNVFLHALVSILLWQVLQRLRVPGAWLAGMLFALHPVNVMSVAWMTELKNTLSSTLALASAWAYLRFAKLGVYDQPNETRPDWRFYILSLFLFLLAMGAKTAVSFLPVTLFLIVWWQRERLRWREVWPLLPMVGIVAALGQVTFYVEHHSGGASGPEFNIDWVHRILISGRSFWFYLGKLFFPSQLTFIYPRWDVEPGVWWQWLFPAATVVVLVGVWLWRKQIGRGVFAGLMHFYIGTSFLILLTVLYFTRFSFVADHWAYFGGMGIMALAAAGIVTALERFGKGAPFLKPAFCGALLLVLGGLSWRQCGMYANIETLWQTTIQRNPDCWMAYDNLGNALSKKGEMNEAIMEYKKALKIFPDNGDAYNALGGILVQAGRTEEAIPLLQKALAINPDDAKVHDNLGNVLFQRGQLDGAILEYQKAVKFDPGDPSALNNLGNALTQKGRTEEAIPLLQKALALNPDDAEVQNNLGNALAQEGQLDAAIDQYQKAVATDPHFADVRNNLGAALLQKGQANAAILQFQAATAIAPDSPESFNNLGLALFQAGRLDEAMAAWQRALALNPNYAAADYNLANALIRVGRPADAVVCYEKSLALVPPSVQLQNNLAWVLATCPDASVRNGDHAVQLAQSANQLSGGNNPVILATLAAAYAETGQFPVAVAEVKLAMQQAANQNNTALANSLQLQLACYQKNLPFRDLTLTNSVAGPGK